MGGIISSFAVPPPGFNSYRFNGSNQYLGMATVTYVTPPFTMLIDCMFTTSFTAGFLFTQLEPGTSINGHLLVNNGTNLVSATTGNAGATTSSGTVILKPPGIRQTIAGVWASTTSRQAFVDGVGGTIDTTSRTPGSAPANTYIWASRHNNADSNIATAGICFGAWVWNIALSATELFAMAAGASPLTIRRGNLVDGWEFTRPDSPNRLVSRILGRTLSAANSPQIDPQIQSPVVYHRALRNMPGLPVGRQTLLNQAISRGSYF